MGYRSSRPKEKATAEAFQQALGKVGIKVNVKPMPDDDLHLGDLRQAVLRGEEQRRPVRLRLGR